MNDYATLLEVLKSLRLTFCDIAVKQDCIYEGISRIGEVLSAKLATCEDPELHELCMEIARFIQMQMERIDMTAELAQLDWALSQLDTHIQGRIYS